jgi:VWFA-related protein
MLVSKEVTMLRLPRIFVSPRVWFAVLPAFLALTALVFSPATAQSSQTDQQKQASPASGGPSGDSGAIAIPKKNPDDIAPPPPPAPDKPKYNTEPGAPQFSLKLEVPEVTVDVGVLLEKNHMFVPGLKPSNFKIYEDGVEQKIQGFKRVEAPITVLLLCEFAARGWAFRMDMLNSAWAFTQQLRPQDYVAMMTFDMNTHIVSDFTQDKKQIEQGINELGNEVYMPAAFSETNIFDALSESLDRLERIQGQKYIILIASGVDTMSKLTLDKTLKRVKDSRDVTVFSIATGGLLLAETEGGGGMMGGMRDLTYLQAQNQLRTFATMTGGMYFEPRFTAELPDDVRVMNSSIRSKYELVYTPSNAKQDGSYRKLRVVLVDDEGQPLRIQDEKHKPLKYDVIARDGYRAKQEVE